MGAFIRRWGNGNAVRIPNNILMTSGINENDEIIMIAAENEIIIRKKGKHRTFSDRMKECEGKYIIEELDESSVGKERFR